MKVFICSNKPTKQKKTPLKHATEHQDFPLKSHNKQTNKQKQQNKMSKPSTKQVNITRKENGRKWKKMAMNHKEKNVSGVSATEGYYLNV